MELKLTTEEVNQILNVLANEPFIKVNGLINKIHAQWNKQKKAKEKKDKN